LFPKRFEEAFKMSAKQRTTFDQLSATFSPDAVQKWEEMVATWNADPKKPNPYTELKSGESYASHAVHVYVSNCLTATTLQDVRLDLLREEVDKVALGDLPRHKISMATFLLTGFELEDSQ
jgi:hypothetical protein